MAVSRVGLGCASLMQLPTRRERDALLGAAVHSGVTHFDVARLYGLGAAESEVGRLLRTRRSEVTIATKFGLAPSRNAERVARFQGPLRAVLRKSERIRGSVKERGEVVIAPRTYDIAGARASLDRSLRELRSDYVDLLFVHEPRPVDEIDVDGLRDFLETARREGKVLASGVSQDQLPGFDLAERFGERCVVQVRSTVLERTSLDRPHLAFGIMSGVLDAIDRATAVPSQARRWEDLTGIAVTDREAVGNLVLAEALAANPDGAVLYATTRPTRVRKAAAVVTDGPPQASIDGLRTFMSGVAAAFA